MQIIDYLRLGVGGILLDPNVFRQQRDAPDGLKRGFMLVLLVGLLVGGAAAIGQIAENAVSHRQEAVIQTVYEGVTHMPWYVNVRDMQGFQEAFDQQFAQAAQIYRFLDSRFFGSNSLVGALLIPFQYLLLWFVSGLFAHIVARGMGGKGTLSQTLGCLALATGANLLAVVEIVPFAQVSGVILLALVVSYLAIRETHGLRPWGAFWATMLGPLVLVLVLFVGSILLFIAVNIVAHS